MGPHRHPGHGEERLAAGGEPCPTHDHAAVLPLQPGTRPLGSEARPARLARPSPRVAALPHPWGKLGPTPAPAGARPAGFGVRPLLPGQPLAALTWSAPVAGAEMAGVQPRDDLSPLGPMGRRGARGPWQARAIREAREKAPLTFAARGAPFTAACARGTRRRRWPPSATGSSRVPQPPPSAELAPRRGGPRPASAGAPGGPRPWTPIGGRGGEHAGGSR
jgi:translation initiation factor IF-2